MLSQGDDKCFETCSGSSAKSECSCVAEASAFVGGRQTALGDRTATIVAFTEGGSRRATRLARTLVCDAKNVGMWSSVGEDSSAETAMRSYTQISAVTLFDTDPKVFATELYPDAAGLGEVFALARRCMIRVPAGWWALRAQT